MSRRRIKHVLGRRAYGTSGYDRYGVPIVGYAPAVDFPVYAVSPKQSVEQDTVGRRPVITGLTVYAPINGVPISSRDRFVFRGVEWDVEGEPGVWEGNPHVATDSQAGIQFDLKRVEG